ncbi:MAG: 1-acyl-sn-glycerol-3-phosphate acyltransferase [Anaerolineaceae bacterium]|nr:1-acyl-sn-glycerol-3-phosphate acyltransferase [Anaerolineaceae bacterium]
MKREKLQNLVRWVFHRLSNLQFIHPEYVPREGGVLIATNHLSRLDIPVLFLIPARPDITALVTDKYKKYAFFRWFTETAKGIWIDRDRADFTAFREAVSVLRQGGCVGISPEGTRSDSGNLQEGKAGTALLALKANVPIVPVGLAGSETALPQMLRLKKPAITARFGPSFHLPPLDHNNREETLQGYTDEIMCRIAAVLPPSYRGFYTDHPRLKELLAAAPEQG